MDALKSILKIIIWLLVGAFIGLVIAAVGIACFTDTSFMEFLRKLRSAAFIETIAAGGFGLVVFALSTFILTILHEAGHLVCGLLSGYKFVSFRVFNLTFIRIAGRTKVKKYSINGTGGQCLLTPPDIPLERIPTAWYNFGGIMVNILAMLAVAPLLLIKAGPLFFEAVVIFLLADAYFLIVNGIPMKIMGVGNDAYNMILLRRNLAAKRGMVVSLRSNALIQQGVVPSELPAEWFAFDPDMDYSNDFEVSIPMMAASRLVDEKKFTEALNLFEKIYAHKQEIIGLFVNEIECEMVYLRLIEGDIEGAKKLLTPELTKYIRIYRKTMSSKERILCAIALKIDNDRDEAQAIYSDLLRRKDGYLLQGEVKSDLRLMAYMLNKQCDNQQQNGIRKEDTRRPGLPAEADNESNRVEMEVVHPG